MLFAPTRWRLTLFFLLVALSGNVRAQTSIEFKVDSLKKCIRKAKHDSTIINAWVDWSYLIFRTDPQKDLQLCRQVDSLAEINLKRKNLSAREKSFFLARRSFAFNSLGLFERNIGETDLAIELFEQALDFAKRAENHERVVKAYGNLGRTYRIIGRTDKTRECFVQCYEYSKEHGYRKGVATSLLQLGTLHHVLREYDRALSYYERSLFVFLEIGDENNIPSLFTNMGSIYASKGDFRQAIMQYTKARQQYDELEDPQGASHVLFEIGIVYRRQGDLERALQFYDESLEIKKKIDDFYGMADVYSMKGAIYQEQGKGQKALELYTKSYELKKKVGDYSGIGTSLVRMGNYHFSTGDFEEAAELTRDGADILGQVGDALGRGAALVQLASINSSQEEHSEAIKNGKEGLKLAEQVGDIVVIRDASKILYQSYKVTGNTSEALKMYERFVQSKDSISSRENRDEIVRQEYLYSFEREALSDSLRRERQNAIFRVNERKKRSELQIGLIAAGGGVLLLIIIAIILLVANRNKKRANAIIASEKQRSDDLLLNILPHEIAEELKQKGYADARNFEEVSIIFTDFQGFTEISSKLSAAELVQEIDTCFKAFDRIVEKYQLEKIKTIGDAYMAVGGLPEAFDTSALNTVLAGLEMQEFIQNRHLERVANNKQSFQMRAGIHTGPVVAGIVGVKKFQYDIWGDTVNTASRIETNGEIGEVNLSERTYEIVKDQTELSFVERESIDVKGKGNMKMFFVRKSDRI